MPKSETEYLRGELNAVRDERDELLEEKRQREQVVKTAGSLVPAGWKLSPVQRVVLLEMAVRKHGLATYMQFVVALQTRNSGSRYVEAIICQMRPKLRPLNIYIETVRGVGYQLTPESVAIIRAAIETNARRVAEKVAIAAKSFPGDWQD